MRGEVEFEWAREQDHVIQRADGTCLYHLASVVDDYDFEITHVIRAEEHLSNTPRQIFIAQSLGYPLPAYAHLPYVAEPGSKNKLSKRKLDKYLKNRDFAQVNEHGLAIAEALGLHHSAETFNPGDRRFLRAGRLSARGDHQLPAAAWAGRSTTRPSSSRASEMIENFSLERVTKAPASFDPKKLWAFQDHYMQQLPLEQKVAKMLPYLQRAGLVPSRRRATSEPKLARIVEAAGDRLKVFGDILAYADFFFQPTTIAYDEKAFEKNLHKPGAAELLSKFPRRAGRRRDRSTRRIWNSAVHEFVAAEGIKIGDIIHAMRVAVTGKAVGAGLYDCLDILGKATCPVALTARWHTGQRR